VNRIKDQFNISDFTVLIFDEMYIAGKGKKVIIGDNTYKAEIIFDFPNSIAIKGTGNFVGKKAIFV